MRLIQYSRSAGRMFAWIAKPEEWPLVPCYCSIIQCYVVGCVFNAILSVPSITSGISGAENGGIRWYMAWTCITHGSV